MNTEYFHNALLLLLPVAPQAEQEKRAQEVQEVTPPAAPPAAEPATTTVAKKLPGRSSSSVHVDYNYFEVGTGQVRAAGASEGDD